MNPQSFTTPLRHGVTKCVFALIALCLAAKLNAQTTFTPTFSNAWVVVAGAYPDLPANSGNNVRGIAIDPTTTNVLYASTAASSNHVSIVSFASGSNYLASLNAQTVSAGTLGMEGVRVANDGTIYTCNLSGAPASRFLIFKWTSEAAGVNPTVVYDSGAATSFQWRIGDYMDVRGSGASTEIVAVGNGGVGANLTTNFVIFRPTDSTCTTFTNFTITIPGGANNLCGAGVAFQGTNNAVWVRQPSSQNTRLITYTPGVMTSGACNRTNTVDQSVCQGLKYYTNNGVELLATVQANSAAGGPVQIARVFQVPSSPTAAFVSVLNSNIPAVSTSQNGNGLGSVDIQDGYFVFGAPGNGLSFFNVGFITNSPPSVIVTSSGSTFVAGYGFNAVFSGAASGSAPLHFQWYQTDNATYTNALSFGLTNVLTLTNVSTANAASYYVIVTNLYGKATSSIASITVLPNGKSSFATNLWSLAPGSRPYLTGSGTEAQRGLAYDTNTTRLVLVTRQPTNGIILLNGADGSDAGNLDISALLALGSLPGTYPINLCGVGDDGIVYVCDLTTSATPNDFIIYSWGSADPSATINQAYNGNPMGDAGYTGSLCRLGDTMAVRGAGTNTQILCTCRYGTNAVIFTTSDGSDFNPKILNITNLVASVGGTDPFTSASPLGLGCAFGAGNTFWGKSTSYELRQIGFDVNSGNAWVIGAYPVPTTEGPLGVDPINGYAGIIGVTETPINTAFYDLDTPGGPTLSSLIDRELFPNNNVDGNGTGAVVFDVPGGRIFTLATDDGIEALTYAPRLFYTAVAGGISISWTGPGTLQSAPALTGPWSSASTSSPYVSTGAAQLFFRVAR